MGKVLVSSTRIISLFVMHSRAGGQLTNYEDFLTWVMNLSSNETRIQVRSDLVFVIERAQRQGSIFEFTFLSGNPDEIPMLFNEYSGKVEQAPINVNSWPVRLTSVVIDVETRLVAIENRRAGVGSANLERYFQLIARDKNYADDLIFDLAVQPSPSFEAELDNFVRIREATVIITRPNNDWDDAEDAVSELADATGAHSATVTVNAARGESLNPRDGLLSVIRSQVSRPQTSISNVKVVGTQMGDSKERSLSLSRHQVKQEVQISSGASIADERKTIREAALRLIESTAKLLGL